jgi:hypothetical protein
MRHGIMARMNAAQPGEAAAGLLPLPRPLMTGEVLDAAFRLFRAGILRCLPYSGLAVLLLEMPTLYKTLTRAWFPGLSNTSETVSYALVFMMSVPLLGAITLRLHSLAAGQRPRFRPELALALRRWPSALIATTGAFLVPVALLVIGPVFTGGLPGEAIFFLSIPLFWPSALFVVALPAFWIQDIGPFAAIAHSARISMRRSWRMVGALLATACVVGVFSILVAIVVGMLSPVFGRADLFLLAIVESILYLVIGALGVPFVIAVLIVALQDLELREQERWTVPS